MQKGKSMKKRGVLSAVIAFALTVNGAVSAYAQTEQVNTAKVGAFADSANAEMKEIAADNEPAEEQIVKTVVSEENLPDSLDTEKVIADGYVARLNSEEQSLSEIVLEKEDGTRSLYLFGENVKYVDENGEVADKSNDAVRRGRAYVNEGNDVEVILPATLTTGIAVTDDELNITMKPLTDKIGRSLSPAKKTADDTVVYSDVFDSSTDIEYTYTYGGVKENIILESYSGKNSFDYEITTGGLTLHEDKGTLLLADESGDVKATLGEVIVFSADNKHNTIGKYKVEELEKNNRYKVTLTVDKEYLTDPDTKYPVKIDPYIKSNKDNLSIQDLQVFKGKDGKGTSETSLGTSGVSRVGWTDWGACRTLLKLNGFSFSSKGIVDASQIQSAYVEIRDLMCQSAETQIVCAMFKGNNWTEKDVKTWNALNAGSAAGPIKIYQKDKSKPAVYQHTVKGGNGQSVRDGYSKQWYAWDITTIAKNWFKNSSSMAKGLVFKTASETYEISSKYAKNMKTFSSMQGNADYKPYVVIEYNSKVAVKTITLSSKSFPLNVNNSRVLTATVQPSNATDKSVKWSSSDTAVAVVDSKGKVTGKRAGKAVITAKSNDGKCKATCSVTVKRVLTSPDTLITDPSTKKKLLLLQTLKDANDLAYIHGEIKYATKVKISEDIDEKMNIARADYIVVGNNPTSEYAYTVLGGNRNAKVPSSFSRKLRLNSSGFDVIVVQRALEVLGYYDHLEGNKYGTFDENTLEAASSFSYLLSRENNEMVFDNVSFNVLFQAANLNERTYANMTALNQSRITHDEVVMWTAAKVGGTTDRNSNKIAQGGVSYKDKEKKIRYDGYADILKQVPQTGTFLWEVKPDKYRYFSGQAIGIKQIQRYINAGNNPNIQQNFIKPLMVGYYVEEYAFMSFDGYYIDVRTQNKTGYGRGLILYEKNKAKGKHRNIIETSPVEVKAKDYEYKMSYNYSYSNDALGSVVVLGVVIVAGVVCVALAPATGGASLIVPLAGCV